MRAAAPCRQCSAKEPAWINVGQSGVPHPAPSPAKFAQEDIFLRVGIPIIADTGLYTDQQRLDMMLQAQRQDAILQVIAHLAHTVVSHANMWGNTYDPSSPEGIYQGLIEGTTSPFPYILSHPHSSQDHGNNPLPLSHFLLRHLATLQTDQTWLRLNSWMC